MISKRLATKKHFKVSPDMKKSRANIIQQLIVDEGEEQTRGEDDGDRFEICDVGIGGNNDTFGHAGIMLAFNVVSHS